MKTSLSEADLRASLERLAGADASLAERYPGESARRQPVHTVYGGAHLFRSDTAPKLGVVSLRALERYAPDPGVLAEVLDLAVDPEVLYGRVVDKLRREPVEDFRIDFEDGYGNRPDEEEDRHAAGAAREVAAGMEAGTLPPFIGIRIKPLTAELRRRAIRTLDGFLGTLLFETGGRLPENLLVTLPKTMVPEQVAVLAEALGLLEERLGLAQGTLEFEIMIETTQAVIGPEGEIGIPRLVEAGEGRCVAAHFGTYDYTAACSITAAHQRMTHPACDFARHVMQVSLAGRGVWLSDGATNVMPVGPHRGEDLEPAQEEENRLAVHRAWRLHYRDVRHSLVHGYYQGWDLHPAQLPTRYAAVYAFFMEGIEAAAGRLRNFVEQAARATLVGDVFDDAATGQGLLNFFLRAVNCGAVGEGEAASLTGLEVEEIRSRSFPAILSSRRAG